jgi:multiple sugar transport system permease protein
LHEQRDRPQDLFPPQAEAIRRRHHDGLKSEDFDSRQFIQDAVPAEILDAARIDGVGEFRMIPLIALPLIRPAIAVLGTITFIGHWNDFMGSLLFLTDRKMFTSLPLPAVFILFSRQIIKNLTAGSIKG